MEIGAGDGGLSLWAALKGARVICSDIDGPSEFAIRKANHYKLNNIEFKVLNALNLPFSNKFDYVLFKSVLGGIGKADSLENFVLMHDGPEFPIDESGAGKTGFVFRRRQFGNFVDSRVDELHFRDA